MPPYEDSVISDSHLLLFTLDEQRYALPLWAVQRVVRAAAPTALPKAPEIVIGILDLQGTVIPVVNVRRRFGLPERDIRPEDQFIVARARKLTVALAVDAAEGVLDELQESIAPELIVPGLEHVAGVTRSADGLVLIHDLDTFLSLSEESSLKEALDLSRGG